MDTDKLGLVIMNNDWGTQMASGDNFYRLLFRFEKKSQLTVKEINSMLASYKNWKLYIDTLTKECHSNSLMEDRKAIAYSETLNDDILKHIDNVLATVKCEDPEFMKNLVTKTNEKKPMNI